MEKLKRNRGAFYDIVEPQLIQRYPGISFGHLCAFVNEIYDHAMAGNLGKNLEIISFDEVDVEIMKKKIQEGEELSKLEKRVQRESYKIAGRFGDWETYPERHPPEAFAQKNRKKYSCLKFLFLIKGFCMRES